MIIGAGITSKQAQLLNQYILALQSQIEAQKRETLENSKLVIELTEENNQLTEQFYAYRKAKENDQAHIRWLEQESLILQRDIGLLITEKTRLQTQLIQAQQRLIKEIESADQGCSQSICCSKCQNICQTVFRTQLSQLHKMLEDRQHELRKLRLEMDKAQEEGENFKQQQSVLLESYKCKTVLQLTQKLSLLLSKEQELHKLKNNQDSVSSEFQLLEAKLSLVSETLAKREREIAQLYSALEKKVQRLEVEKYAYQLDKKNEENKRLISNEQHLNQKIKLLEDNLINIEALELQKNSLEKAAKECLEVFKRDRNLIQIQLQNKVKIIDNLQQLIKQHLAQVDHITKQNDELKSNYFKMQKQAADDKSKLQMISRRIANESSSQSIELQTISNGVVILNEALGEQKKIIDILSDAVRQKEETITLLENSNSELRKQIVSAINSQEYSFKELTRQRDRVELRERKRQKPYFFSRVTSYDNQFNMLCKQSAKNYSTETIAPFEIQPQKVIWTRSEGSHKARRSLVQEIIHLNQQSESEETQSEVVKVCS